MLKKSIFIILLSLISTSLFSDHFQNGNLEFSNKNFKEAEIEFLAEINESGYDVNTLFNLGNTYIKLGDEGRALFYFYKSRMINPRDPNINSLINNIEESLNLKGQFTTINPFSRIENITITLIIILLLSILFIILTIMNYKNKRDNLLFKIKNIIIVIFIIFLISSITGNIFHYANRSSGIVFNIKDVLISPYNGSEVTFKAKEGSKIKITDEYDDFIFINDQNGRYGWIDRENIGILWK